MENKNNSFETQLILSVGKESLPHVPQSQYGKQIPFQPPPELNRALSCEDNQPPPTSNFSINTFSLSDTRVTTADSVGEGGGHLPSGDVSHCLSHTMGGRGVLKYQSHMPSYPVCPRIQCAHLSSVPTYPCAQLSSVPTHPCAQSSSVPTCLETRVPRCPVCPPDRYSLHSLIH